MAGDQSLQGRTVPASCGAFTQLWSCHTPYEHKNLLRPKAKTIILAQKHCRKVTIFQAVHCLLQSIKNKGTFCTVTTVTILTAGRS